MALQLRQTQTRDGKYAVTYAYSQRQLDPLAYIQDHLDAQELEFAAHGLHTISPAEKGLLMAGIDDSPFTSSSTTDMDIFYDPRDYNKVVLARGRAISQVIQSALSELREYNRYGKEFSVPQSIRGIVYDAVDTMLHNGRAFATRYERIHKVSTYQFGEDGITNFMYGDQSLDIDADKFGAWLAEKEMRTHTIVFESILYVLHQSRPFVKRLRLLGSRSGFEAVGGGLLGHDYNAFGVLITRTAEAGQKNLPKHKG
ncbi:MAG TPA: hypothetical protein VJH97_03270 [Candidatus Nanoarchaeia archaeon]|nr:hypothetical protein [Candidatus Nanoarchaeia archaeon]